MVTVGICENCNNFVQLEINEQDTTEFKSLTKDIEDLKKGNKALQEHIEDLKKGNKVLQELLQKSQTEKEKYVEVVNNLNEDNLRLFNLIESSKKAYNELDYKNNNLNHDFKKTMDYVISLEALLANFKSYAEAYNTFKALNII